MAAMNAEASPELPSRLDAGRIAGWTAAIVAGMVDDIRTTFRAQGARGPDIVWQPSAERLAAPQLRFLRRYWTDLARGRAMPRAGDIDAIEMRPALGYVVLLDVIAGGRDFHYRLFGSLIAAASGFDVTGKRVSQHKASPHIVEFALAGYGAALARKEPLLTEHGPPPGVDVFAWHRLILPLAGETGAVTRFLIGNVPMGRDGRPVPPRR
jgi:hypothetical protein